MEGEWKGEAGFRGFQDFKIVVMSAWMTDDTDNDSLTVSLFLFI